MTDLERAMADVAFIQRRLAESTRFSGLTPSAVAATGVLALVAALVQRAGPQALADEGWRYVAFWSVIAFMSVALIGGEALVRARHIHGSMADQLIASTLRTLLPFLVAGAGLTLVLLRFAPGSAWMLPGLWQLLIALAGLSSAPMLPRAIAWPAAWYFGCAFVVLAIGAQSVALAPWMMGVPFGVGQLLVALVLYRAARAGA